MLFLEYETEGNPDKTGKITQTDTHFPEQREVQTVVPFGMLGPSSAG